MNSKHFAALAVALAGTLAVGAAQARGQAEVQWSVTIGSPQLGVVLGSPGYGAAGYGSPVYGSPVYAAPIYSAPVYTAPIYAAPVYAPRVHAPRVVVVPAYGTYRAGWRDADRDGIPNRYDRRYNPRGDRDRDGIPNRRDPRPYGR